MIATGSRRAGLLKLEDNRGLASLPIIRDWHAWWREWGPKLAAQEGKQGWILFLLDAHEKLTEVSAVLSRLIRNKPEWGTEAWSQAEWENVEDVAGAAKAWFERNHPRVDSLPEYAGFLVSAQYGLFCVLTRLARELRALQEQGYNTVVLEKSESGLTVTGGADTFLEEVA